MTMTKEQYLRNLLPPTGTVDAVLDTDTYNEIDDQFALSYMVRSSDRIRVQAFYAAPFFNANSTSPADGMERSYKEIHNLLGLLGEEKYREVTFRGSDRYLPDEKTPVESDAARDLVERAKGYNADRPLYVVAIGAITNVASAILMDPSIKERIVIVWLGGHAQHWPDTHEFNMFQDVAAARVVFTCGAPFVQLPCFGVVSAFTVSGDDLRSRLYGKNDLCNYLVTHTEREISRYVKEGRAWSRVIWDVTAVAWLTGGKTDGKQEFLRYELRDLPMPEYDNTYSYPAGGERFVYVYHVDRDALWNDMITKLSR